MTPKDYWDRHPDIALAADDGEILDIQFEKKADAIAFLGVKMKKEHAGCYSGTADGYDCVLMKY